MLADHDGGTCLLQPQEAPILAPDDSGSAKLLDAHPTAHLFQNQCHSLSFASSLQGQMAQCQARCSIVIDGCWSLEVVGWRL